MALTYLALATTTVNNSTTNKISFNSIPGTYTDLQVLVSSRSDFTNNAYAQLAMTFNNDGSPSIYFFRYVFGDGATASSGTGNTGRIVLYNNADSTTSNTFGSLSAYIPNYTGSNLKACNVDLVTENNGTTALQFLYSAYWNRTDAITSLELFPQGGSGFFIQNTTATLYGIKNTV